MLVNTQRLPKRISSNSKSLQKVWLNDSLNMMHPSINVFPQVTYSSKCYKQAWMLYVLICFLKHNLDIVRSITNENAWHYYPFQLFILQNYLKLFDYWFENIRSIQCGLDLCDSLLGLLATRIYVETFIIDYEAEKKSPEDNSDDVICPPWNY